MPYFNCIAVLLASSAATLEEELRPLLLANQDRFTEAVLKYLLGEVTPQSTLQFEMELAAAARELGCRGPPPRALTCHCRHSRSGKNQFIKEN